MVSFTVYSFVFSTLMTTTLQFGAFPGNTADLERMKKLAEIRMKIRSKIGLIDRPFVSKPARNRFTKTLLKNTISIVNKPRGEYYAEIQKVIRHSQIPENMTDSNVVQFKVVRYNQGRKLEITSANIIVKIKYKRKHPRRLRRRRKLKLKKISLKLSTVDSVGHPVDVVSSITTKIRRTKWLKVPLPTKVIESAMQRIDGNLYLHLNCEGCDKAAKLILINGHRNKIKKGRGENITSEQQLRELKPRRKRRLNRTRPFLILYTKVKTYIRSKRDAVICKNNSTCCMDNLNVDFDSIGWGDWVIAPKSFETGVCQGVCSNNPSSCQETKSQHLVFLYSDGNGNVILTSLPNMIITECGCSHSTEWIHKS